MGSTASSRPSTDHVPRAKMPSPSPTAPSAAFASPRRPSSPSSCPPKRKRALSVVEDGVVAVDSASLEGSASDDEDHDDDDEEEEEEEEEEGRSACRALLSWHRNGDRLHDVRCDDRCDDDDDDDDDEFDGSAVSVLAEHLRGLGFRVGKSVPSSSSSLSFSASDSASSNSVSVYRDSLPSATTTKTKTTAVRRRSSWDQLGGDAFWRGLLGVHARQSSLERTYRHCVREEYGHLLLLEALRDWLAANQHKIAADTDDDGAHRRRQLDTVDRLTAECLDGLTARLSNSDARVPSLFPASDVHDARRGTTDQSHQQRRFDEYDGLQGHDSDDDDDDDDDDDPTSYVQWLHKTIFTGVGRPLWTVDQVRAERARIRARNSTLSNAYLQVWQRHSARRHRQQQQQQQQPDLRLTRIEYHTSPNPKYERFKLFVGSSSPTTRHGRGQDANLILLPCLARIVNRGVEDVAQHMVQRFWDYLERVCHYQSTSRLRSRVSPSLGTFFASGLSNPTSPACIALEATFLPTCPFSLYLHGEPGTGKSSFVRHLGRALRHVLSEHVDPTLTRLDTVKQMLNKPSSELALDLELRRNNNDLSLSSLLLSRRQRNRVVGGASESAAGLVVLALEELAPPATTTEEEVAGESEVGMEPARPTPDPNQHGTLTLLTQRLSGRSGAHSLQSHVRSNGVARSGVSGDPSIVTVMTSNYALTDTSLAMLRELHLFVNLTVVAIKAMEGEDRQAFATSYLHRYVQQQLRRRDRYDEMSGASSQLFINFGVPEGYLDGDVRPLVRMLRMLAYYIAAQVSLFSGAEKTTVNVAYRPNNRCVIRLGSEQTKVAWDMQRSTASDLLVASNDPGSCCHPQTSPMADSIRLLAFQNGIPYAELLALFEFWLTGALAPAVIISTRDNLVESILSIVSNVDDVHVLRRIDAGSYRMMRSLYDPIDTPNLRDDIRRLGTDKVVVVELVCQDVASQLCIREVIEDTPSMTAYSSLGSALHKEGLLFLVRIKGCEITPEIRSRASLVL